MTDTIQHLTYDDFGRVIRNDRGGSKADMSYVYDQLHGWTTGVRSGGGFEQKLYRETGALLLKNGKAGMYQFQGGYYSFDSNGVLDGCHYYIQDYLGPRSIKEGLIILREKTNLQVRGIRMTVSSDDWSGIASEYTTSVTDYYPYGNPHKGGSDYKYSGKYLDRTYGLDLYDFEARRFDAIVPVFGRLDPLAWDYTSLSPYVYCAGDPENCIDPDGKRVEFADNVSDEFKAQFADLVIYMNSKGTSGDLAYLEKSDNVYYINSCDSPINSGFAAENGTYTITINLEKGIETTNGIIISPATTAAHEFGHAASYESDSKKNERIDRSKGSDKQYGTKEERRNIESTEQIAARKHGEIGKDQVTRYDHSVKRVVRFDTKDFSSMSMKCHNYNKK